MSRLLRSAARRTTPGIWPVRRGEHPERTNYTPYKYFAVWPIPAVGQRLDGHSQPSVESALQQNTVEPFTSRSGTRTDGVCTLVVDHWCSCGGRSDTSHD